MVKGVNNASETRQWEEERKGRGHDDELYCQVVVGQFRPDSVLAYR